MLLTEGCMLCFVNVLLAFDLPTMAELLRLALPVATRMITEWVRPLLFNVFVSLHVKHSYLHGRDAARELDAVGLAIMTLNLLLFASAYGFNGAIDTFTANARISGSGGIRNELLALLQRQMILLCGVIGLVAIFLFCFAEHFFLLIGAGPELAAHSALILRRLSWAVPGDFAYDALARWMRGQQLDGEVAVCSLIALTVNLGVNLVLIDKMTPTRAPIFALIAQNSLLPFLLLAAYANKGRGLLQARNSQPEVRVLGPALWEQLRIGIVAMLLMCLEMWAWEVQVFQAHYLGTGAIFAYTLLSSSYSLLLCIFPISVSNAASTLIYDALHAGDVRHAVRILRAACMLSTLLVALYGSLILTQRETVAKLLGAKVGDVVKKYVHALPLVISMHFLDGLFHQLKAWLTVRGQSALVAVMSLLVLYYAIGLPIGTWFTFTHGWGMLGLWSGLATSVFCGWLTITVQVIIDVGEALEACDADADLFVADLKGCRSSEPLPIARESSGESEYSEWEPSRESMHGISGYSEWNSKEASEAHLSNRGQQLLLLAYSLPGLLIFAAVLVYSQPWRWREWAIRGGEMLPPEVTYDER